MKSSLMITCLAILTFAVIGTANSIAVFEDNFDAENGGLNFLNYYGFDKWTVTNGTVDLIGRPPWDWFYASNLMYVDMDGSTGDAGKMTSDSIALIPNATYTLTYELAGNQREAQNDSVFVLVNGGSLVGNVHSLSWTDSFTTFSATFNAGTATTAEISFEAAGGDNIGMLLDNVKLEFDFLAVEIDIKPETLNLKSGGEFTAFIDLPEGYDESEIDVDTLECEGAPALKGMMADDGRFIAKFDREDLDDVPTGGAIELTVTGKLNDGTAFAGSDIIRVIGPGKPAPSSRGKLSAVWGKIKES